MGRIRTVKPELIQQPWFATLTDAAARTYYGLLSVVDDAGRCAADPAFIAGQIFWGRQRTAGAIGRQLAELERANIIQKYTISGSEYLQILGWHEKGSPVYQQINKPQGEKFPAPESTDDRPSSGRETGPDPIRSDPIRNEPKDLSPAGARAIPPAPPPHTTPSDGGQLGSGKPGPRETQQEAATSGQSSRSAVGNVAEPQIGPTPDRSDRPPSVGDYDHQDPSARGRLADLTYRRVSDARVAIAAELRLPAPLPFPLIAPSSRAGSFRQLLDRVREEGTAAPLVCGRVVDNLIAQAREERSVEWLAEKAFGEGPWRTAREWMPGAAARRRGPQRGDLQPPPRKPDPSPPVVTVSLEERSAAAAELARARAELFGAGPRREEPDPPNRGAEP